MVPPATAVYPPVNSFANRGAPWSPQEDAKILGEALEGLSFDTIAANHGRTKYACQVRIYEKAIKMAEAQHRSLAEVAESLHITVEEVQGHIQKKGVTEGGGSYPRDPQWKGLPSAGPNSKLEELMLENNRLLREVFELMATNNEILRGVVSSH